MGSQSAGNLRTVRRTGSNQSGEPWWYPCRRSWDPSAGVNLLVASAPLARPGHCTVTSTRIEEGLKSKGASEWQPADVRVRSCRTVSWFSPMFGV